jgi:hypothetical protein
LKLEASFISPQGFWQEDGEEIRNPVGLSEKEDMDCKLCSSAGIGKKEVNSNARL